MLKWVLDLLITGTAGGGKNHVGGKHLKATERPTESSKNGSRMEHEYYSMGGMSHKMTRYCPASQSMGPKISKNPQVLVAEKTK